MLLLLVPLLALASAQPAAASNCYCNTLRDFCYVPVSFGYNTCTPPLPTAAGALPGYTFHVGQTVYGGVPLAQRCFPVKVGTSLEDLASQCDDKVLKGCAGFSLDYLDSYGVVNAGLQVCYWADVSSRLPQWNYAKCAPAHEFDQRCYGTWVKNPPPVVVEKCDPPPPPPPSPPPVKYDDKPAVCKPLDVPEPCDCTAKYGAGSLAESKCFDCKKTRPDAGDECCSCRPNKHDWMTVICIDCVVTAHPKERKLCEPCNCLYEDGTNGLVRCWECVKLANLKPAYVPGYKSKADMCHNFCRILPTPRWTNMTDPSQCLDCVKDPTFDVNGKVNGGAATFSQVPGNPNGECPTGPSGAGPSGGDKGYKAGQGRRSRHF